MKQTHNLNDVKRLSVKVAVRGFSCTDTTTEEAIRNIKRKYPDRKHFELERMWTGGRKLRREKDSPIVNTYILIALPEEGENDNKPGLHELVQSDLGL